MMLEELYNEMLNNEEFRTELTQTVNSEESLVSFLRKHGCDATWDEYQAFMMTKRGAQEMSDEELGKVAGGSAGAYVASVLLWWSCASASIAIELGTDDDCIDALFG